MPQLFSGNGDSSQAVATKGFAPTSTQPSKTGCSNTRSKCQDFIQLSLKSTQNGSKLSKHLEASVDYLVFASTHATHDDLQQMIEFIAGYSRDEWCLEFNNSWSPGRGCKKYQNSGSSVKGCKIGWNIDSDGVSTTWFSIPGQVLRAMTPRDIFRMCTGLNHRWGVKCRRFDSALDDYLCRVRPNQVLSAARSGDVALLTRCSVFEEFNIGEVSFPTVYLGSRESEKFLRCYDHQQKHGGEPCIRWEAELKRRHAEEAFNTFVNLPFDPDATDPEDIRSFDQLTSQFLGGLVIGVVDFVEKEEGVRYSRRKRLSWWASLCDEVGAGIRLSPARPKPSLERSKEWFVRQVAPFLAALKKGWGAVHFYAWLFDVLESAVQRFTPYHEAVIRLLKGEVQTE